MVAYKNEGFTMFHELMNSIWEEFTRVIYHVEVNIEPADLEPQPEPQPSELSYAGGGPEQPSAIQQAAAQSATATTPAPGVIPASPSGGQGGNGGPSENPETVVKADRDRIGRNDPCWCGSGKKYKKCHGA
jgi:preprotein translocase subunit SecA